MNTVTARDLIGLINEHALSQNSIEAAKTKLPEQRYEAGVGGFVTLVGSYYFSYFCLPLTIGAYQMAKHHVEEIKKSEEELYNRSMAIYKFILEWPSGELHPLRRPLSTEKPLHTNLFSHDGQIDPAQEHAVAFFLPSSADKPQHKPHVALIDGKLFIALPIMDVDMYTTLFTFAMEEAMKAKAQILTFSIADKKPIVIDTVVKLLTLDPFKTAFKEVWIVRPISS